MEGGESGCLPSVAVGLRDVAECRYEPKILGASGNIQVWAATHPVLKVVVLPIPPYKQR